MGYVVDMLLARGRGPALVAGLAAMLGAGTLGPAPARAATGPCTETAAASMPIGDGHNHRKIDQHRIACRIRQVAFMSLDDRLAARGDVILGEMDIEGDRAAVAVAYPEAGFLLFDISNRERPRFLSWFRSSECEGAVIDVDCGAYIDLSENGKTAFLALQQISVVPGGTPPPGTLPASAPGIQVVDLADPRKPLPTQLQPVLSLGGVHAASSYKIPDEGQGARLPGEYLFAVANGFGIEVMRVDRRIGRAVVVPVNRIDIDEVHDLFVQNDPTSGRTYLYVAAGFASGFYVYDVTDPTQEKLLGEWDLTPGCSEDWYSHTIDVATRGGRRYLTMPAELFRAGKQPDDERGDRVVELAGGAHPGDGDRGDRQQGEQDGAGAGRQQARPGGCGALATATWGDGEGDHEHHRDSGQRPRQHRKQ